MIIELPEIACVLIHGCNRATAGDFAARNFAAGEILDMGSDPGDALLDALRLRVARTYRPVAAYLVASRLLDLRARHPELAGATPPLMDLDCLFAVDSPESEAIG